MSVNTNWNIDKHRDDNEYEDHWELRRKFMERWKSEYPEERLVTLSKLFTNIEFLGCKYSPKLMEEVARMSKEIAKDYRKLKSTMLQRTFVSASDAAEDRARGTKREGGVIVNEAPKKFTKIAFVKSGEGPSQSDQEDNVVTGNEVEKSSAIDPFPTVELKASGSTSASTSKTPTFHKEQEPTAGCSTDVTSNVNEIATEHEKIDYMEELSHVRCVPATNISDYMFNTRYGRLVLLVRSWEKKLSNIQTSCQLCGLKYEYHYDDMTNICSVLIEGNIVAQAYEPTKKLGKKAVENLTWEILTNEAITILVKELFLSKDDSRISLSDVSGGDQPSSMEDEFGAPVDASVAAKMMKMMGWQGGGLGADAQGIAEPVKPHMQMINRAGLGSVTADIRHIRTAADSLVRRYLASDCLDLDLIFSSDFTKEERTAIHQVAQRARLRSRSYGQGAQRFLVVKKKIDVFHLAQAIVKKGGSTPKYEIFIPAKVASFYRESEYY